MTAVNKVRDWKKMGWNAGGILAFGIWLYFAGFSAENLDDTVIFFVGLITFVISTIVNLALPKSKMNIVRVARVAGDIGAATLVLASYKHLSGYPFFGLTESVISWCAIGLYLLVAMRIFRDI